MFSTIKLPRSGRQKTANLVQRLAQSAAWNILDGRKDAEGLNRLERALKASDCYSKGSRRPVLSSQTMALVGMAF